MSTVIVCWPGGLVDDVVELESGRPESNGELIHESLCQQSMILLPESMLRLLLGV